MKILGYLTFGISLTLALIGFLIAVLRDDKELGSQVFMSGFLLFICYAVVSGLAVGGENRKNPASSFEGKSSLLGFSLIGISGAVDYFVDLRGELLALVLIFGGALMALGLAITVYKAMNKSE